LCYIFVYFLIFARPKATKQKLNMKTVATQKRWKISDKQLEIYSLERIEKRLKSFNQLLNGQFYMVDYCRKKIIVDSSYAPILCGHPKELIETEGFDFFSRILKDEEFEWIKEMNVAAFRFCFRLSDKKKRKDHVVSYDTTVKMWNNKSLILRHKVVPYKLCKNGNVWLGLCFATVSTSEKMKHKASITDRKTGQKYDFINGYFIPSSAPQISPEEIQILKWMVLGLTDKYMCSLLNNEGSNEKGISLRTFNARKRCLFKKLGVNTSTAAVHEANLLGII